MKDQILKLKQQGKSYREIQKELNCSKSTICYYLNGDRKNKQIASNKKRRLTDRKNIKIQFGGKCSICGYSKCLAALQFHHIDPNHKKFGITYALRNKPKYTEEEIIEECKKCIILCSNCHFELHYPENIN